MRSVFFRRLVLAIAVAMLVAAALMFGGYVFVSRDVYTDIKLDELQPSVNAAEQLAEEYITGHIDKETFLRLASKVVSTDRGTAVFVDANGNVIYYSDSLLGVDADKATVLLADQFACIREGEELRESKLRMDGLGMVLAVGAPVKGEEGALLGAVLMLKSSAVITGTTTRMSTIFLWMAAFAIPVGLLGLSWRVKNITEPLNDMSEAAMQMAKGNFDIRLDEEDNGEIGMLAKALNHLCSELSRTIHQLGSEKSQLDQILQSLTDGVAATDESGVLTHYNTALMRMFGAVSVGNREDLISDDKVWSVFDEVYRSGKPQTISYPMPGDRMIWISVSPVTTETLERVGVVGLFKDMTEMERLESLRREYVANVSHELRTPLTAVRGLLEPLADGMVKEEADRQRYYKIMLHEVMRLSRLITDMMTLSRLQSGTEYMEISRVNMNELIDDIASGYSSAVAQKGVELIVDSPRPVPDAMTDPDRVEQVLVILLDNAVRYTPKGGSITIGLRNLEKHIAVTVTDTGCGIPEKDLPHIFERFYKVDKSRSEGGTGLGLSIAQYIMEKLDESLTVESEVGTGTRFTLTIKRYVRNAIALGPAGEKQDRYGDSPENPHASERLEESEAGKEGDVVDAPYEVIKSGRKHE